MTRRLFIGDVQPCIHLAKRVDSFAPARSASGLAIYVAPLPGGCIQCVCHATLDFIQVPGFPSAIRMFALTLLPP